MKKLIVAGVSLLLVLLLVLNSCSTVKSTERAVSVVFGKVQEDKDIHAGLNFKIPFIESIKKYSIEPNQLNMVIEPSINGALTRDNQTVGTTLKIVWKYDENKIVEIAKNYSEKKLENIVLTISEAGAKNIIGQYDIFSLAEKQEVLSREIKARMEEIISDNNYPLVVVDVQTTNFDWSDEFDRQIALTMNRAQEVKQSQQELEKTKIESQKQVAEAEAKRASDIARAEGEQKAAILRAEGMKQASIAQAEADLRTAELRAEAKIVEGDAIKKYNESIKSSLDVELALREIEIEKIRVSRWNGVYVPNNMYGPIPVNTTGGVKGM
jgi:regulator of protease activity HflC (stomatin/prohibitin superfamily)